MWKEVQTVDSREEKNRQWMPETGEGRRETEREVLSGF